MKEIANLPVCSGDKALSLRYVFDKINVNVRELESSKMHNEQCGGLLISTIMMAKQPNDLCLLVAWRTDQQLWEIKELLAIIKKEVEVREAKLSNTITILSTMNEYACL